MPGETETETASAASERTSRIKTFLVRNRSGLTLLMHTVLVAAAYIVAYLLRFDWRLSYANTLLIGQTLPLVIAIKLVVFRYYGLHQGLFRYAGIQDVSSIVKASTLSSLIFMMAVGLAFRMSGIPRSVFVIDWLLTVAVFAGKRLSFRMLRERHAQRSTLLAGKAVNTLIVGAGDAGELALRELQSNPHTAHHVIGFLDDDPHKRGMRLRGVPILGGLRDLPQVVNRHQARAVLIAMPSAGQKTIRAVVDQCAGLNIQLQILPAMADLITGKISVQAIRDVRIEDLLFRAPVTLESGRIRESLQDEVVLISGAGGSIGSELARQAARQIPSLLVLLDIAETPLFEIEQELLKTNPALNLKVVIGDVRDATEVRRIFDRFRPSRVFHAAAYKHVPLMESHPHQAVINNIKGTRNLAEAARDCGVERFVMISTDKAVHPCNVMGMTKRVCELLVTSLNGKQTRFAAVRFGNVLGSNGSVIPTFRDQIRQGGPLTVTHPAMTRYFMTIPEAVMLVLQCGAMALDNEIFVLDMGQPVRIMDLAENMIRLSGLRIGVDIDISITGLRPGERLHEELVSHGEAISPTDIPKINVLRKHTAGIAPDALMAAVLDLESIAQAGDEETVRCQLNALIEQDRMSAER